MLKLVYTLMIALSAGVITMACCRAMQFVYPSLKLFFPNQSDALPYGAVVSVVALCFLLAAYVTPLVVLGGFVILIVLLFMALKPLPQGALLGAVIGALVLSLLGELPRIQEAGYGPLMLGMLGLYVALPLLAYGCVRGSEGVRALQWLVVVLVLVAIAAPVVTQAMTHGTPASLLTSVCVMAGLYCHARKPGALGAAALLPLALVASHVGLTLAHAGFAMVALVYMGVACAGFAMLAMGRAA